MTATSQLDRPVYFEADGEQLFGVFSRPEHESNGVAVLVLFGAGSFPTSGKNQVRARLAHLLTDEGYHVLRIDYRGVGDSAGELREAKISNPWVEDAYGAVRWLGEQGFDRILVVGVCFGSVVSLAAFPELPHVVGIVLVGLPMVDASHREARLAERGLSWYLKRATSLRALRLVLGTDAAARRRRATLKDTAQRGLQRGQQSKPQSLAEKEPNPQFLERVGDVLGSGLPVLLLYGRRDAFFASFERARLGRLGQLIDAGAPNVHVQIEDGSLVSMGSVETQEVFLRRIVEFARGVALSERGTAASTTEHRAL